MAEFKKPRFGGGRRPFPKDGFGGRNDSRRSDPGEMYDAECNRCHDRCQVPFRPSGVKPVYCKNCFSQSAPSQSSNFRVNRDRTRSESPARPDPRIDELKKELTKISATLEKLVTSIESSNRAAALTSTVRRLVPASKPANAPQKMAMKKPAKKAVKKAAKKTKKA